MKNNAFIVVSFLILFQLSVVAQDLTYSKVFYDIEGGVQAYSMVESFDHNYMIVGQKDYSGLIIKMDPSGNIIWARSHGEYDIIYNSIIVTSDSCFVLAGYYINPVNYEYDVICTKLNQDGDTMWSRIIDAGINEVALSVNENDDHVYILTGYTSDYPNPDKIFVSRLNSIGDMEWITTNVGGNNYNCAYSAKQIPDGGFILIGFAENTSFDGSTCIVKLLPDGTVSWSKKLDTPGGLNSYGIDFIVKSDGLFCSILNGNLDFLIIKTDFSGNIMWTKCFYASCGFSGYLNVPMPKLRSSSDGGFVLVTPGQGGNMLKMDTEGNLIREINLVLIPTDVIETPDKGFIIIGNGPLIGCDLVMNPQIGIIKTDSLGVGSECAFPSNFYLSTINTSFIDMTCSPTTGGVQEPFYPEISTITLTSIEGCVEVTGGIEEIKSEELMVYPNPTNGTIDCWISNGVNQKLKDIEIINRLGQSIYFSNNKTFPATIDLEKEANGIYFLIVRTERVTLTRKIILNR
jgi:hypothetical protein